MNPLDMLQRRTKVKSECHFLGISRIATVKQVVDSKGKLTRVLEHAIKFVDSINPEDGEYMDTKMNDINKKSMYLNQVIVIWLF